MPQVSPRQPSSPTGAGSGYVEAFFGDRGTGKSTLARKVVLADTGPGTLTIYSTPNGSETDPWPGPDWSPYDRETRLPYTLAFRGEDMDDVCQFAIDCSGKFRVKLVVDEAHETFPEHFPSGPRSELFHRGRHYGVGLYLVSQWPAACSKRIFRAARAVYWFRLHASEDLFWIRKRWGPKAASQLSSLPNYKYVRVEGDNLPPAWRDVDAVRPRSTAHLGEEPDHEETPPESVPPPSRR